TSTSAMPTWCWGLISSGRGGSGCRTAYKRSSCCVAPEARCQELAAKSNRRAATRRVKRRRNVDRELDRVGDERPPQAARGERRDRRSGRYCSREGQCRSLEGAP